jgi:hypothetical protein
MAAAEGIAERVVAAGRRCSLTTAVLQEWARRGTPRQESMELVNNLCSWLKRYLWRFTGMSMSNMQSYLNWYVYLFRVNQARDRWPETARVVRHMLMADASFRSST